MLRGKYGPSRLHKEARGNELRQRPSPCPLTPQNRPASGASDNGGLTGFPMTSALHQRRSSGPGAENRSHLRRMVTSDFIRNPPPVSTHSFPSCDGDRFSWGVSAGVTGARCRGSVRLWKAGSRLLTQCHGPGGQQRAVSRHSRGEPRTLRGRHLEGNQQAKR